MSESEKCLKHNDELRLSKEFWRKLKNNKSILHCLDCFLTLAIIGPLTVLFWRGTWEIMEMNHEHFRGWPTYFFSMSIHFSFALIREPLQTHLNQNKQWKKTLGCKLSMRLYIYVFAVVSVMQWRSVWVLLDSFFLIDYKHDGRALKPIYFTQFMVTCSVALVLLGLLKIFKNILSAPYTVGMDFQYSAYDFPTRFKTQVTQY